MSEVEKKVNVLCVPNNETKQEKLLNVAGFTMLVMAIHITLKEKAADYLMLLFFLYVGFLFDFVSILRKDFFSLFIEVDGNFSDEVNVEVFKNENINIKIKEETERFLGEIGYLVNNKKDDKNK